jgi:mRNA interferase MazF
MAMVKRFEVYLINLDERPSEDAKNTRPAVVISPDEVNRHLSSVIVAPLSSTNAQYPTRVPVDFLNDRRFVILDQIHAVDTDRFVKKIGELEKEAQDSVRNSLVELFA